MYTAAVITISDKGHAGIRVNTGGPLVESLLQEAGFEVVHKEILPDDRGQIEEALIHACDQLEIALVVTTGGTGFSPRDITPEATLAVVERHTPGIPEAMRAASAKITNRAMLSRAQAGIRKNSLILNLPGSPKAIKENLEAVLPSLEHGLDMLLKPQKDH